MTEDNRARIDDVMDKLRHEIDLLERPIHLRPRNSDAVEALKQISEELQEIELAVTVKEQHDQMKYEQTLRRPLSFGEWEDLLDLMRSLRERS